MGIRCAVFDEWLQKRMDEMPDAAVIHIGCGMDGRILRTGAGNHAWYDVDFPEVIAERKRYYSEAAGYQMLPGDARNCDWLQKIPENQNAIVVMEGVSMYLSLPQLHALTENLCAHFRRIALLMDCYTVLAAKMSKYKNPVHGVGVHQVYGIAGPQQAEHGALSFITEHPMTPEKYIDALRGGEKLIFRSLYAGRMSKKLYRLYEYRKG